MKKGNNGNSPSLDWDNIELQVYALRAPGPPEQKLKKAKELADIYRKAGKPLPDILAVLA